MFKKYGNVFRILISIGILGAILFSLKDSLLNLKGLFLEANYIWIAASLGVYILCTFFMAIRLKVVLSGQDIHLPVKETWELYWVGYFFNIFLPSSVGGDVAKAYYAGTRTNKKMQTYTSVFLDRLFGMLGIMIVAGGALLVYGRSFQQKAVMWGIAGMLIGMFCFIFFLWSKTLFNGVKKIFWFMKSIIPKKIIHKVNEIYHICHEYRGKKSVVLVCILISVTNQFLFAVSIYFISRGLGATLALSKYVLLVPIVGAITTLPSINGLGIREGAFVIFFQGMLLREQSIAISIIWSSLAMLMSVIGGIVYITHPNYKINKDVLNQEVNGEKTEINKDCVTNNKKECEVVKV